MGPCYSHPGLFVEAFWEHFGTQNQTGAYIHKNVAAGSKKVAQEGQKAIKNVQNGGPDNGLEQHLEKNGQILNPYTICYTWVCFTVF